MLETRNLIFTEDLNIGFNLQIGVISDPTAILKRLYWLKNDEFFEPISGNTITTGNTADYRTFYVEARFFKFISNKIIKTSL